MCHLRTSLCLVFAICLLAAHEAGAQGGPPMLTDDPGTPGNGNFEVNIAATVEARRGDQSWELPALDINYGVGERIQLNLELSYIVAKRNGDGPIGGPGNVSTAVKWRLLDQEKDGIAMSVYPRLDFNVVRSSVRRGIVEDGTRVLLPLQIAHPFGKIDADIELGSLISSVGRSEWIYGLVVGTAITPRTEVMAELHGSARTNFERDRLTINVGLRQKLTGPATLIVSLGHEVRSPPGEALSLVGYFGVQLVF
jgi:hypothetical protein